MLHAMDDGGRSVVAIRGRLAIDVQTLLWLRRRRRDTPWWGILRTRRR